MNIKSIPKVEHHCHLEACFTHETALEIGSTLGLDVPRDMDTFRREWLIAEPVDNLELALGKFVNIQKLWGSLEAIERLTRNACLYAVGQGIKIFELRYSPTFIASGHAHLSFEDIHSSILKGLEAAKDLDIAVGLIGIVQKILPQKEAERVADFIVDHKDTFVAIDLADQDVGFEIRRFIPLIEKARNAGLHVTTHSGEDNVPEAPQQVRVAIEELGAERIGHGLYAVDDPEVVAVALERKTLFELCPTSNWLTSAVPSVAKHPIRRFMDAGIPVSINSDDPGIFAIDLCDEYEKLHRDQGFTEDEFTRINDLAAAFSFVRPEEKRRVWPRAIPEFG